MDFQVDENGRGWFCRHFHTAMAFARDTLKVVRKAYFETAGELDKKFDAEWRKKVRQFQMPLFSSNADAAWILRFDDVMADALELGPLRRDGVRRFRKTLFCGRYFYEWRGSHKG